MSKVILKVSNKLLALAERLYDRIEGFRINALYREAGAVKERERKRFADQRADTNLLVAIQAELAELEGDDDDTDS